MKVKIYHSGMYGAPIKNGVPGCIVTLLNAVCVTGFAPFTMTSLTVTDGVARAEIVGALFEDNLATIRIAGSATGTLNGDFKLSKAEGSVIEWPTDAGNGSYPVAGVTGRIAPLGWTAPFTGTNEIVLRSPNPLSSGYFLHIRDQWARYFDIRAFKNMRSLGVGSGVMPNVSQSPCFGFKSQEATTTERSWVIVGDDRGFYFTTSSWTPRTRLGTGFTHYFGDYDDENGDREDNFFINGDCSDESAYGTTFLSSNSISSVGAYSIGGTFTLNDLFHSSYAQSRGRIYLGASLNKTQRSMTALMHAFQIAYEGSTYGYSGLATTTTSAQSDFSSRGYKRYPLSGTNSVRLVDGIICDNFNVRGKLPGLYYFDCNNLTQMGTMLFIEGRGFQSGQRFFAVPGGYLTGTDGDRLSYQFAIEVETFRREL